MDTRKEPTREDLSEANSNLQGNDKAPGEENGKSELVTNADLKGKKVDADPSDKKDQPLK